MKFNFAEIPPLVFFGLLFITDFVLFLVGGLLKVTAGENNQQKKKGDKFLSYSRYGFFITFLMLIVFILITFLLTKEEKSKLPFSLKKTPPPPFINYPPPPQFIKIGNFYFSKPLKLNEENYITVSALYAILCKKNNKYDIIYIGNVEGNNEEPANLLENEQYNCWLEYCGQETKNLYVAFRILKKNQKKKEEKIQKILEILENQTNPVCQTSNSHSESINN